MSLLECTETTRTPRNRYEVIRCSCSWDDDTTMNIGPGWRDGRVAAHDSRPSALGIIMDALVAMGLSKWSCIWTKEVFSLVVFGFLLLSFYHPHLTGIIQDVHCSSTCWSISPAYNDDQTTTHYTLSFSIPFQMPLHVPAGVWCHRACSLDLITLHYFLVQ